VCVYFSSVTRQHMKATMLLVCVYFSSVTRQHTKATMLLLCVYFSSATRQHTKATMLLVCVYFSSVTRQHMKATMLLVCVYFSSVTRQHTKATVQTWTAASWWWHVRTPMTWAWSGHTNQCMLACKTHLWVLQQQNINNDKDSHHAKYDNEQYNAIQYNTI